MGDLRVPLNRQLDCYLIVDQRVIVHLIPDPSLLFPRKPPARRLDDRINMVDRVVRNGRTVRVEDAVMFP